MLSISNLSVFIDQKQVLKDFNLAVEPGTVHALMGPNGSGKSTLAYTVMGHPSCAINAGEINFKETTLNALSPEKRAKMGLFLAFQHPMEIPGVKVLTFLKEAYTALTGEQPSMQDFNVLLLEILQQLAIDPGFAYRNLNEGFSGGEKKRLEIVQMLLFKPSLVILDEIDSGLDIDGLKLVAQALIQARKNNPALAIIIITHYQRILQYIHPDYVHIVSAGAIVKTGTAALAHTIECKGYDGAIAN